MTVGRNRRAEQGIGKKDGSREQESASSAMVLIIMDGQEAATTMVRGKILQLQRPRAAAPVAEEAQNRVSAPAPRYNERYNSPYNRGTAPIQSPEDDKFPTELDSGITVKGILEVMAEG